MNKAQILIVEDESNIRRFVRIALEQEGMSVIEASTLAQARMDAATRRPDLMIVDLGLPDGDGKDLIRDLRSWVYSPILVLSAREREEEKVAALNAGADDYLVKPFGVPELLARIRALLRRSQLVPNVQAASSRVRFGGVQVDLASHEVTRDGEAVHLTPIEFRLLTALIRGHGKVLTHQHLLHETWGAAYSDRPHYLRVYMMQLRQKLEEDAAQPKYLLTELQVGYRLAGLEVEE
ncbi:MULTISPECIES: response regulator [Alcaligenes]|jgi:two-component system KDP operon response regulator KdpE|uniref:Response regulator n=2 Tax=Alcaligenes faecalis TaxID=511 RepID=A0ABY7N6L2_ALCFA|nr:MULTISPECIES: response regulator [Alcaligenes]MBX6965839.1 response regulator [Providencia rettgeri]ARP53284.1 Fis family transcriptional regulator [Alcaligenes faecalis]KAA1286731.1 response regulator [Alcaligenes faecalis]MBX7031357.1 response regulator [Alcaligenes faecalis]MDT0217544.1 response regulator [Alcaligenes sp. AB3]